MAEEEEVQEFDDKLAGQEVSVEIVNALVDACGKKLYEHYLKAKSILQNELKLIELDQFFLKNKGFK